MVGISYNHESGNAGIDHGMNYRVDTSASATAGFRAMGATQFFNPVQTFYSSKGISGPNGSGQGTQGSAGNPPAGTTGRPGRTPAQVRNHRRHVQKLRAQHRRSLKQHRHHRRHVRPSVSRSGVTQTS